jgi:ABC-type dipeptide/oligopeptide/nickel transport system ATPase subunit
VTIQRVKSIAIKDFKAFKDLTIGLNGRHLLAYGPNGSGKSSLYWALYTFLQSARKETTDIAKYFTPNAPEKLLHYFADQPEGSISLKFQNTDGSRVHQYEISKAVHGTHNISEILTANLAADFITYRVLFQFYNFRNSDTIDLWPVFEKEIMPFCRSTILQKSMTDEWNWLITNDPGESNQNSRRRGATAIQTYDDFEARLNSFNKALEEVLGSISAKSQEFFDTHFKDSALPELQIGVALLTGAAYDRKEKQLYAPHIGLGVQLNGEELHRPQSFLNEAKLTQIALAVRFGATLAKLQDAPLKLLVLDDLLISLDMDNRMAVVDIILGETFADYQKIILTHDLGFFREFRRAIGSDHPDWCFQRFNGAPQIGITLNQEKTEIEKAEDYLNRHDLEEAAGFLRKAAEDSAKGYREWAEKKKLLPGEFHSLTENLRAAKNKLLQKRPMELYSKVLKNTPPDKRKLLVLENNTDLDKCSTLSLQDQGILKCQRKKLRQLLTDDHWGDMEAISILDDILKMTNRVLNPAAHWGEAPLYKKEVQKALKLIYKLEHGLKKNIAEELS